jgi:hypothetical protein
MAKVVESGQLNYLQISAILNFISSLNCPLFSVDTANHSFSIDNKLTAVLSDRGSNSLLDWSITYNGTTKTGSNWQWTKIKMAYTDNFVVMVTTSGGGGGTLADQKIIYEKIGSRVFAGILANTQNEYNLNIRDRVLEEYGTGDKYVHKQVLPYIQESGYIDYTEERLFIYDTSATRISNITNPELLSCSTAITTDQIITFEGENYLALGTNTLIKLDSN